MEVKHEDRFCRPGNYGQHDGSKPREDRFQGDSMEPVGRQMCTTGLQTGNSCVEPKYVQPSAAKGREAVKASAFAAPQSQVPPSFFYHCLSSMGNPSVSCISARFDLPKSTGPQVIATPFPARYSIAWSISPTSSAIIL